MSDWDFHATRSRQLSLAFTSFLSCFLANVSAEKPDPTDEDILIISHSELIIAAWHAFRGSFFKRGLNYNPRTVRVGTPLKVRNATKDSNVFSNCSSAFSEQILERLEKTFIRVLEKIQKAHNSFTILKDLS